VVSSIYDDVDVIEMMNEQMRELPSDANQGSKRVNLLGC
jgi:hypothetical protein